MHIVANSIVTLAMSSWHLWLCMILLICTGIGIAVDVPLLFNDNSSGVASYNSDQIAGAPVVTLATNDEVNRSIVNSSESKTAIAPSKGKGLLFTESSSVKGRGEASIKGTIQGTSMAYNEKAIGNGSISLETLRCIDRRGPVDSFTEKKDLVFDGNLKGHKTVASPTFQKGLGASVSERFNFSHVDKSQTSSVSSNNFAYNTLTFKTDQAFDGTWNIQTRYAELSKKMKTNQWYTGSFQTQKDIKFQDAGQR